MNEKGTRPQRNRRRRLIVNPVFQWKYAACLVLTVFLVSTAVCAVVFGVMYYQARSFALGLQGAGYASTTVVFLASALGFALAPALAFGLWSVFLTHRICGPLYAMQRDLQLLTDGHFPKYRPLRRKDEFKSFHKVLWQTFNVLRQRRRLELSTLNEISDLAESALHSEAAPSDEALHAIVARVDALRARAAAELGVSCEDAHREREEDSATCSTPPALAMASGC